jgi:hypothetical protein
MLIRRATALPFHDQQARSTRFSKESEAIKVLWYHKYNIPERFCQIFLAIGKVFVKYARASIGLSAKLTQTDQLRAQLTKLTENLDQCNDPTLTIDHLIGTFDIG